MIDRPFVDGDPASIIAWWYRFLQPVSNALDSISNGDSDWITPTLLNGWAQYSSSYPPPQYRKRGPLVMMRGLAKNASTASGTIFTLPADYLPGKYVKLFPGVTAYSGATEGFWRVDVRGDSGDVYARQVETGATYGYACFANITYLVDQ